MRNQHADPTADAAIGAADKEWFQLVKLAIRIKSNPELAHDPKVRKRFMGIYQRLMEESPEDLDLILKKKKQ